MEGCRYTRRVFSSSRPEGSESRVKELILGARDLKPFPRFPSTHRTPAGFPQSALGAQGHVCAWTSGSLPSAQAAQPAGARPLCVQQGREAGWRCCPRALRPAKLCPGSRALCLVLRGHFLIGHPVVVDLQGRGEVGEVKGSRWCHRAVPVALAVVESTALLPSKAPAPGRTYITFWVLRGRWCSPATCAGVAEGCCCVISASHRGSISLPRVLLSICCR